MEEVATESVTEEITFEPDVVYKEDQLRDKMILLLKLGGNNACIECNEADPQWASVSLGIFLCITCSGIHRNLGVHISRVKSLFLDNWKKEELDYMRDNGNLKSKRVWEAQVADYFVKPCSTDSVPLKEQYIRSKYERKEYVAESARRGTVASRGLAKEGFLTKKGSVVKNWKKRWFVLSGSNLLYFKKQKDVFPAGVILVKDAKLIDCVAELIDNKTFCFMISTPGRDFFISADSGKDMFDWVQNLKIAKSFYCTPKATGKRVSDFNIKDVAAKLSSEISIQKRKLNSKTYPNCFVGTSAVDWMVEKLGIQSRSEAVELGKKLLMEEYIQSVVSSSFLDDYTFYQVLKTQ